MKCTISHKGVIRSISNECITIAIKAESACGGCHAKTICGLSEVSEKLVNVRQHDYKNLHIGDTVLVSMDSSLGTKAVLLAYIIPLFILISSLLICLLFANELIAATVAILVVFCYFWILYKNKSVLEQKFSFSIIK